MLILTALIAVAIGLLLMHHMNTRRKLKMLEKVPGMSPILPFLGNSLSFEKDSLGVFRQFTRLCQENYEKSSMFKVILGHTPMIIVYKADLAEEILKGMKNLSKSLPYLFLEPWLGTGLLLSTGSKWQKRRKMLTPTFHFKILNDFMHVFNDQANVLVSVLEKKCQGQEFDIFPCITMCALDIICETAMGTQMKAQTMGEESQYVKALFEEAQLVTNRINSPWQWNDFLYRLTSMGKRHEQCLRILKGFTSKVITDRKQEMIDNPEEDQSTKKKRAFLDLLLHMSHEAGLTDQDIQEEVDTFMFEGHDTTAAGMAWTVQLIGRHPEVQAKLHEEMDEIFRHSDRPCTTEDLTKMKYLECVIKESLRICPPVPMVGRTVEEDTEINGVVIPKGASLSVFVYLINRDPQYFENPEKFDPDHFKQENASGRHPYTFIPFSAGPRNCIGQRFALNEEKVVLSTILRNFHIEATQRTEDIAPIAEIVLRPGPVIVKLTKRI